VQLGSLVGDTVWAAAALAGGAFLLHSAPVRRVIGLAGGALLLYLAAAAFRDAARHTSVVTRDVSPEFSSTPRRGDFGVGAALSLGNPFAIAFWLGVGTSVVSTRFATPGVLPFAVFLAGVTAGGLAWSFVFAGMVAVGRRRLTPSAFRLADGCCGAALAWFGVDLLRRTMF
jgi:threonine/homoserine/homoserine lactone efflux protein